jgi:hypothetical protein
MSSGKVLPLSDGILLTISLLRHEHIYDKVERHLLRSDEFPQAPNDMERAIGGSPVILCTLSMLSNPILDDRRVYELVPLERLVIDEASQIDVGEFMVGRFLLVVVILHLIICSSISSTSSTG